MRNIARRSRQRGESDMRRNFPAEAANQTAHMVSRGDNRVGLFVAQPAIDVFGLQDRRQQRRHAHGTWLEGLVPKEMGERLMMAPIVGVFIDRQADSLVAEPS